MFGDTKELNAEVNLSKNYDHMIQWPKAGISIRGGTRYFYPPNMVFAWYLLILKSVVQDIHENCSTFNKKYHL
jgi:hypothetical protein